MKYVAGAFLYALWAALVFLNKADPQPLIAAIGAALSALGFYHAITNLQAVEKSGGDPAVSVADLITAIASKNQQSAVAVAEPSVPHVTR